MGHRPIDKNVIDCLNAGGTRDTRAPAWAPLTRITHYKVWQDGNHPVELSTNEMIDERLHYLHYNPVEAGIVWEPQDYCYSSAIDYSGGKGFLDVELLR